MCVSLSKVCGRSRLVYEPGLGLSAKGQVERVRAVYWLRDTRFDGLVGIGGFCVLCCFREELLLLMPILIEQTIVIAFTFGRNLKLYLTLILLLRYDFTFLIIRWIWMGLFRSVPFSCEHIHLKSSLIAERILGSCIDCRIAGGAAVWIWILIFTRSAHWATYLEFTMCPS